MKKLLALTVLFTLAAHADWAPIGPDGGQVQAVGIDPLRPDTVYCMVYVPDTILPVYRTTDRGANWSRVGGVLYGSMGSLVVDRFSPNIILGPSGNPFIERSTDGGATWFQISIPVYASVMAFDPFVPGRVYAAGMYYDSFSKPAFAVSTDHGLTWSDRLVKDDTGGVYGMDLSPADSGTIYLSGDYGTVFRSTDAGLTWQERSNGLMPDDIMLSISVNHGDPRIICGGTIYGMFRTTDAGENWQQTGTPRFVMSVDFSSADPAKGFAYGYDTASVCFYTTDAGVNWTPTAAIAPSARLGGILADPGLGDGAWCPTVAGMQYTTDRGAQWTLRSSGIRTATISTISVPPWNPGRVYVEVSGAGVYRSNDAGATWQKCADFLSCGNICGIGLGQGPGEEAIWALEGSG